MNSQPTQSCHQVPCPQVAAGLQPEGCPLCQESLVAPENIMTNARERRAHSELEGNQTA